MNQNIPPKFQTEPLSDDKKRKLMISFEECEDLTERKIECPYCKTPLHSVFSDTCGHLRVKCQKCKAVMVLSLAYFRRQKGYGKHKQYILEKHSE